MASPPPSSQELHAIDGLLLLNDVIQQRVSPLSTVHSAVLQSNTSLLVTPPSTHNIESATLAVGAQESTKQSPVINPYQPSTCMTNPVNKKHHIDNIDAPYQTTSERMLNPYKTPACIALTPAQKNRIAINKAMAIKRQETKQLAGRQLVDSQIRSIYGFTLSQEEDLVASFIADDKKRNHECILTHVENPYVVKKRLY